MKKQVFLCVIMAIALLISAMGGLNSLTPAPNPTPTHSSSPDVAQSTHASSVASEKIKPACNGTTITANCTVDGVDYTSYMYHPAVPEKSHTETLVTYKQQVTGTCTVCGDGTYAPSCTPSHGGCAHHTGVAQRNAPQYTNVPEYDTKKVIDTPAQAAYYEKITE